MTLARLAPAQQSASEAEKLFRDGLEAMRAEHYDEACPKLRESYGLDPLPGALFTLAECEAAWGKSATAMEHYQTFINNLTSMSANRRDQFEERRRLALDKIAALAVLAPEITIDVAASAPPDLVVKRNDVVIDRRAYGVGKKVDRGIYVVSAELKGKLLWKRRIEVLERDRAHIQVPWPPPRGESAHLRSPSETSAHSPGAHSTRTRMYVTGGLAIAGLATGAVAGVVALGKKGTIEDNCPDRLCNAQGHEAVATGQSAALVSSIGFALGVAGTGATVALFLLSRPDGPEERATGHRLRPIVTASQQAAAIGVEGFFR